MISEQTADDYYEYYKEYLSKTGKTYAIDFMIGNDDFIGKEKKIYLQRKDNRNLLRCSQYFGVVNKY